MGRPAVERRWVSRAYFREKEPIRQDSRCRFAGENRGRKVAVGSIAADMPKTAHGHKPTVANDRFPAVRGGGAA